mmetsp:Transcript_7881/g.11402  ORF Transcript_7881/g.11402 Transcript_7881/m.11402 type:complete len:206 (-) Transcript_7881:466-1083(-)
MCYFFLRSPQNRLPTTTSTSSPDFRQVFVSKRHHQTIQTHDTQHQTQSCYSSAIIIAVVGEHIHNPNHRWDPTSNRKQRNHVQNMIPQSRVLLFLPTLQNFIRNSNSITTTTTIITNFLLNHTFEPLIFLDGPVAGNLKNHLSGPSHRKTDRRPDTAGPRFSVRPPGTVQSRHDPHGAHHQRYPSHPYVGCPCVGVGVGVGVGAE